MALRLTSAIAMLALTAIILAFFPPYYVLLVILILNGLMSYEVVLMHTGSSDSSFGVSSGSSFLRHFRALVLGFELLFLLLCAVNFCQSCYPSLCTSTFAFSLPPIFYDHFAGLLKLIFALIILHLLWTIYRNFPSNFHLSRRGLARLFLSFCLIIYIHLSVLSFVGFFQRLPELTLYLILINIMSDTGGYIFGRLLKGPKLLPSISPNKTWSGTIGGWLCSIGAIFVVFYFRPYAFSAFSLPTLLCLAFVFSLVAQLGDLFLSAAKRFYGVKDTSHLIPGHGGLLDRFDSLLLVMLFASFLTYFFPLK